MCFDLKLPKNFFILVSTIDSDQTENFLNMQPSYKTDITTCKLSVQSAS